MDPTSDHDCPPVSAPPGQRPDFLAGRLQSLDAYRGLIMITLAFSGFGLARTAARHLTHTPESAAWLAIQTQFSHAEWAGCSYWDLIQPSFMFMVGVSMAYSYVKRQAQGQSPRRMLGHAASRAVILVLLGVLLSSNWSTSTNWSFMNVLSQIGLGYTFLFLLWGHSPRAQMTTAVVLLAVTWVLYAGYPSGGGDPVRGGESVGVSAEWAAEHLAGMGPAWQKNANVGHAIDRWLLNLFPREKPFEFNRGGYQTINFIPSLATMIFGLMCGELLRSSRTAGRKLVWLGAAGLAGIVLGLLLSATGLCPLVKRIWTPSWTVYSSGWCCLILAGLYGLIDVCGWRRWAFPLVVIGLNSIAVYFMGQLLRPWVGKTLSIHLGPGVFDLGGETWRPLLESNLIGLAFWLICYWMYRQRIFFRI